ncbi:hypothetical protein [uncultured Agathobaculum sp.]|uniref:hypothetical protein n=1 Tax=uncultured Agathobaculum sp. TaxID=2048140 RepID=UPI00296E8B94
MSFKLISALIGILPVAKDEEERLRQYARALDALSPPPELADKTAQLLAKHLGL